MYSKIYEVKIGTDWDVPENMVLPGFLHMLQVVAAIMLYCEKQGYYLVLNDHYWRYGKWCDYLEPFWDESEKERVLSLGLPTETIDINQREPHSFGQWYSRLPYIQPILWNQMVKIETQSIDTKNIFVLADTYRAIDFFKNLFGHSVHTLCPKTYDGIAKNIRTPENLLLYLTEIEIASHQSNVFVGSVYASAPKIIRQIRENKNSFLT